MRTFVVVTYETLRYTHTVQAEDVVDAEEKVRAGWPADGDGKQTDWDVLWVEEDRDAGN